MRLSLKVKFLVIIVGVLTVLLGVVAYLEYRQDKDLMVGSAQSEIHLVAEIIRNGLVMVMMDGRPGDLHQLIGSISSKEFESACLQRPDGTVISCSLPSEKNTVKHCTTAKSDFLTPIVEMEGNHPAYRLHVPIYNEKPCMKCHDGANRLMGVLTVSMSLEDTYRRMGESRVRVIAEFLGVIVVLSVILMFVVTLLISDPLNDLIAKIKRVEGGDMHVRFSGGTGGDAIARIASSLDDMLDKINAARRELEDYQTEAVHKLEKMATIGELASAIAHEIKNPLAGISGAIQVFAEDFPEGDNRRDIINDVLGEIARLDKAVKDLLAFARPPEPSIIAIPTDVILERVVRLVIAQARKQGVEIRVTPDERPVMILVDPEQIQQVFLNIMMNALHSMPQGGVLSVSVTARAGQGEADIKISDNGMGISDEEMKNIFKPFYTTKHMGTGLGLTISKNIVEKNKGRIAVSSIAGKGTMFTITLPLEGN